jgi:hypothetical protein
MEMDDDSTWTLSRDDDLRVHYRHIKGVYGPGCKSLFTCLGESA